MAQAAARQLRMTSRQHLGLSAFWFANNLHWAALAGVMIGSQSERFAAAMPGGLDKARIAGLVVAAGSIVGAVTPPLVGALSDRSLSPMGRRRPFVIAGTLINVLGLYLAWLAFTHLSLVGYILSYLVIQLGNNIAIGAYSGIIPDVVPEDQRGTASGFMAAMTQVGSILGLLIAGRLVGSKHPQDLLCATIVAATLIVFAGITVVTVREVAQKSASRLRFDELLRCFWVDPRRYPDFAWVWVTRALFTAGWWMVYLNLYPFLRDVVHAAEPGKMLSALGGMVLIGATVTGLGGGILSDRWSRKGMVFLAGTLMAVAAFAFATVTALGVAHVAAVFGIAIFWGLGYGAYYSVDWALGTDVLPNLENAGKDMGVWHLSMVLPQTFAPLLAGQLLYGITGGAHPQNYSSASYTALFIVAAIFMLLSAVFIWRVKKSR